VLVHYLGALVLPQTLGYSNKHIMPPNLFHHIVQALDDMPAM